MSLDIQIEVRFKPEADQTAPSEKEIALIYAIQTELLRFVQEHSESDED